MFPDDEHGLFAEGRGLHRRIDGVTRAGRYARWCLRPASLPAGFQLLEKKVGLVLHLM